MEDRELIEFQAKLRAMKPHQVKWLTRQLIRAGMLPRMSAHQEFDGEKDHSTDRR